MKTLSKLVTAFLLAVVTWPEAALSQAMSEFDAQRIERRAIEAAYWGMPLVNYWAMREGFENVGAPRNTIAYLSQPMDWKLQVTTPNNTTLYIMAFWNTEVDGPIVLEVPPTTDTIGLFGTAMDTWQTPLVDMGGQGYDRGAGARYLFLPPGYQDIPPEGYVPIASRTNNGWLLLRTLVPNFRPETLAQAEDFIRDFRLYPLSKADAPPATQFLDVSGTLVEGIAPYDDRFFDGLNEVIQEEPVLEQDLAMMGMLQTLGIEKGREFNPTRDERAMLSAAAKQAQAEFKEAVAANPDRYWPDRKWSFLLRSEIVQQTDFTFAYPRLLDYVYRGVTYYSAFSSVVTYGTQTQYLVGGQDSEGRILDGGASYTLNVPANVPVRQFWSVLVYDLNTAGFIMETPKAGVSSLDEGLAVNLDGSVDVFFGPKAPAGKESNWAPTVEGRDYFLLFRFYGPEAPFYDKTWSLNDLIREAQ